MKKRKITLISLATLSVLLLFGAVAVAAYNYGTESNPLIAKSYLDNNLEPRLVSDFQKKLDSALSEFESSISTATASYKYETIDSGKTFAAQSGAELILRSGSLKIGDGGYAIDSTDGTMLSGGGVLMANHLYLFPDSASLYASAASGILAAGTYTIS